MAAQTGNPWKGQIRPGVMAGNNENETDFFLDLFFPLRGDDERLIFFNPHLRLDDDDGNEQNLGFGYRGLYADEKIILGANAFFDAMHSPEGNQHYQFGLGAEALTKWVDLRANYYHPFHNRLNRTPRSDIDIYRFGSAALLQYRGFEEAPRGYDAEVGVLVPGISDYVETRAYIGGYVYDSKIADDIEGVRSRVEVRPAEWLVLSAEFKDDDVKSATFVGGYLDLPFDMEALFEGRNPFEGVKELPGLGKGARDLRERMTEKVVRDRHIATFVQKETAPQEAARMIYVNSDVADDPLLEDGTLDHPFDDVAEVPTHPEYPNGAWVYVFSSDDAADAYSSGIQLADNSVLWGQGYYHPLYRLGGGPQPVLDGGTVSLGENNEVMGLAFQNAWAGIDGNNRMSTHIHDNQFSNNSYGIYIQDISSAYIHNNQFSNNGYGIYIENYPGTESLNLNYTISNNQISDSWWGGVYLYTESEDVLTGTSTASITGNTVSGNDGNGIHIENYLDTGDISGLSLNYTLADNQVTQNSGNGIYIYGGVYGSSIAASSLTASVSGNTVSDNGGDGVYVYNDLGFSSINNLAVQTLASGNTISNNGGFTSGLHIENYVQSWGGDISGLSLDHTVSGNQVAQNGGYGVYVYEEVYGSNITASSLKTTASGNTVSDNDDGVYVYNYIEGDTVGGSSIGAALTGNTVSGNSNTGVDVRHEMWVTDVTGTTISDRLSGNTITGNGQGVNLNYSTWAENIDESIVNLFMQGNAVTDNFWTGVQVGYEGDGTFTGDLGGGALGSTGRNSFHGNDILDWGYYDLDNWSVNAPVKAENNWWGQDADPGDSGQIADPYVDFDGDQTYVDYTPWLTSAP